MDKENNLIIENEIVEIQKKIKKTNNLVVCSECQNEYKEKNLKKHLLTKKHLNKKFIERNITSKPEYMNNYMKNYISNQDKIKCPIVGCDSYTHKYNYYVHCKSQRHIDALNLLKNT